MQQEFPGGKRISISITEFARRSMALFLSQQLLKRKFDIFKDTAKEKQCKEIIAAECRCPEIGTRPLLQQNGEETRKIEIEASVPPSYEFVWASRRQKLASMKSCKIHCFKFAKDDGLRFRSGSQNKFTNLLKKHL